MRGLPYRCSPADILTFFKVGMRAFCALSLSLSPSQCQADQSLGIPERKALRFGEVLHSLALEATGCLLRYSLPQFDTLKSMFVEFKHWNTGFQHPH